MPKKIYIILLFTSVIATAGLFAATQVVAANGYLGDGNCDPAEAERFQCYEKAGYVVEILPCDDPPCSGGEFPRIVDGNSVFKYRITEKGSEVIRYINLLIPAAQGLEILSSDPPTWILFTGAQGDIASKFGRGLTLYNTVRLDRYDGKTGDISLTLQGRVPTVHNAMGLVPHSDWRRWGTGEILLPGGPPPENAKNEPIPSETIFIEPELELMWKLKYDKSGNSYDAECDCMVKTVQVNQIPFSDDGELLVLDSLPFDDPFVVGESPGCTYVRTRSGGVKAIGDTCP